MLLRFVLALLLLPFLSGCLPGEDRVDEEKDPHFQEGRNLVNSQDYKGAIDEFEKALQSNPRSGAAHFALGLLYDRAGDYAAAIYHYQRFLQARPNSPDAQNARDRIRGCKQELANSEFPLPNGQNLQREVDRLRQENAQLRQDNAVLRGQVDALRTQLAARPAGPAPQPTPAPSPPDARTAPPTPGGGAVAAEPSERPRVYVVKAGDTISAIAAHYGIKKSALMAANPRVDPRKLHVGQTLNLP